MDKQLCVFHAGFTSSWPELEELAEMCHLCMDLRVWVTWRLRSAVFHILTGDTEFVGGREAVANLSERFTVGQKISRRGLEERSLLSWRETQDCKDTSTHHWYFKCFTVTTVSLSDREVPCCLVLSLFFFFKDDQSQKADFVSIYLPFNMLTCLKAKPMPKQTIYSSSLILSLENKI